MLLTASALAQDRPTYQSLWDEATEKTGCAPAGYADFTLVTCREDLTLWYFTKPNHPANPGVIKRAIVQTADGAFVSNVEGWSFAPDDAQPAFKNWLSQINELDRRMKEDIEKRRSPAP